MAGWPHPGALSGARRAPRGPSTELCLLVALVALVLLLLIFAPHWMPSAPLLLLVVIGGFVLRRSEYRLLSWFVGVGAVVVALCFVLLAQRPLRILDLAVVLLTIPLMSFLVRSRSELGLTGDRAAHLLLEMRSRLSSSTGLPPLPRPWHVEAHVATAFGETFGGDVVVSARSERHFEVAIIDVAGNGLAAAARSTQLTGALGALIGSVPPAEFVPRANDYVVRQGWDDGFATLVHVAVDLPTGRYTLGRAGHPAPLVHEHEGRWSYLEGASSTPLGVVAGAGYPRLAGLLQPGDAIVLYSDGLVESRHLPSTEGAARLLRDAHASGRPFGGAAARLAQEAPSGEEDRTVVCLWRDAVAS